MGVCEGRHTEMLVETEFWDADIRQRLGAYSNSGQPLESRQSSARDEGHLSTSSQLGNIAKYKALQWPHGYTAAVRRRKGLYRQTSRDTDGRKRVVEGLL